MAEFAAVGESLLDNTPGGVTARPASTVILTRPVERGFEVLLGRRLASAAAFAGVFVFPGGGVRLDDYDSDETGRGLTATEAIACLSLRGGRPPAEPGLALAYYRAAIRELFEEAGILLARDKDGRSPQAKALVHVPPSGVARHLPPLRGKDNCSVGAGQQVCHVLHFHA